MRFKEKINIDSNVHILLKRKSNGELIDRRDVHNIFTDYGREWLSELIALNAGYITFRNDRIRYVAFGIGGTSQLLSVDAVKDLWAGWSDYVTPVQTDTDPEVTGLEYPVLMSTGDYYDNISAPAIFPEAGTVRFTSVLGYNEVTYPSGPTSVPLSEMGMFTQGVTDQSVKPVASPPERYMVAYNTFDTLVKTNEFVLQVDWELIFS
jgi:hypothetical protein